MARLVDIDAALDSYYAEWELQDICSGEEDRDWLMKCIDEAPTVEAESIKHGKWVFNEHQSCNEKSYFCSECATGESDYGTDNFCSNCGADMRGE